MDRDTLKRFRALVEPLVGEKDERSALMRAAFFGNTALLGSIDYSGAANTFSTNLIVMLSERWGTGALCALLDTVLEKAGGGAAEVAAVKAAIGCAVPPTPEPPPSSGAPDRVVRVLFVPAQPIDQVGLRLAKELKAIDEMLRLARLDDRFALARQDAPRRDEIQGALLNHTPHILHFSGHGNEDGELIFEDAQGKSAPVDPTALARTLRLLGEARPRLVVLNACYSAAQADAIASVVDVVIGMARAVNDETASAFSRALYQAIAFGRTTADAFALACNAIDLQRLPGAYTPKLLGEQQAADQVLVR